MNLNELVKGAVRTTKKKAVILRVLNNLDDVVFTIYTNKEEDAVVIKARLREDEDESE